MKTDRGAVLKKARLSPKVWFKILVSPSLLLLVAMFLPSEVKIPISYYIVGLGLIYALAAQTLELIYYAPEKIWKVTIIDTFLAGIMLYLYGRGFAFRGAEVTVLGALIYGLLQGAVEHLQHIWMKPKKKKWQKEKRNPLKRY